MSRNEIYQPGRAIDHHTTRLEGQGADVKNMEDFDLLCSHVIGMAYLHCASEDNAKAFVFKVRGIAGKVHRGETSMERGVAMLLDFRRSMGK